MPLSPAWDVEPPAREPPETKLTPGSVIFDSLAGRFEGVTSRNLCDVVRGGYSFSVILEPNYIVLAVVDVEIKAPVSARC